MSREVHSCANFLRPASRSRPRAPDISDFLHTGRRDAGSPSPSSSIVSLSCPGNESARGPLYRSYRECAFPHSHIPSQLDNSPMATLPEDTSMKPSGSRGGHRHLPSVGAYLSDQSPLPPIILFGVCLPVRFPRSQAFVWLATSNPGDSSTRVKRSAGTCGAPSTTSRTSKLEQRKADRRIGECLRGGLTSGLDC
jgi:hypothetical protein